MVAAPAVSFPRTNGNRTSRTAHLEFTTAQVTPTRRARPTKPTIHPIRAPTYQAAILLCVVLGTVPVVGGALLFLAGPGLLIGGLVVAATGATGLGRSLTPWPAPVDDNELGTTGIYGLVRHPQYSGEWDGCGQGRARRGITGLVGR